MQSFPFGGPGADQDSNNYHHLLHIVDQYVLAIRLHLENKVCVCVCVC